MAGHPTVTFRIDPPVLALVDAFLETLKARNPDAQLTRADAFRVLVRKGLDSEGAR